MTLFITPSTNEHTTFLKHITAEQLIEKEGEYKWQATTRNNHYLDALCLATTAARKLGVASLPDAPQTQQRRQTVKPGIAPAAQQTRRRGTIRTKY
jgi:hypothetical protein